MEPKFQSSFIPKGPIATTGSATRLSRGGSRSVLGTLAAFIFALSVIILVGVFGYERFLISNISKMGGNLTTARASLKPEVITKISHLDERIISTRDLLENHIVLSPLFDYLENSTLKTVRFSQFQYQSTEKGLTLNMRGQARGYSAVALQSEVFNKSPYLKEPIFADLDLDDRGNVTFSFRAVVDPSVVSYKKDVANMPNIAPVNIPPVNETTASTTQ